MKVEDENLAREFLQLTDWSDDTSFDGLFNGCACGVRDSSSFGFFADTLGFPGKLIDFEHVFQAVEQSVRQDGACRITFSEDSFFETVGVGNRTDGRDCSICVFDYVVVAECGSLNDWRFRG
ncbi:hypothetical protein CHU70_10750 (plasmid) [Corynebacterium sp. LK10]|nr:hypothetical protein CHU70_10750 [Corynebacterium sp. LK10]